MYHQDPLTFIVSLIVLVMSIVIHELSHGYVAELLGDPTPRMQGRLTLNPIKHMELFGSVIVPILTAMSGFPFGWAKPVEWNPYNIKNRRTGELFISLAGPVSNLLIAIVFGMIIRFGFGSLSESFIAISAYIVFINIALAIFNLVPIPPLDGSKVLFFFLPPRLAHIRENVERYAIFLMLIFILVLWKFIEPVVPFIFQIITGASVS